MANPIRAIVIATLFVNCWLGMQAVHEAGHVLGVWASGGRTVRVVWHPLTISRTDFADCPHPAGAVWAGPIVGVLGPLAAWGTAVGAGLRQAFLLRFFAGFCLLTNGAYLAGGSFAGIGDCGELLNHGVPQGALLAFGALTIPAGLFLWHGQGPHFGLGPPLDGLPPRNFVNAATITIRTTGKTQRRH